MGKLAVVANRQKLMKEKKPKRGPGNSGYKGAGEEGSDGKISVQDRA